MIKWFPETNECHAPGQSAFSSSYLSPQPPIANYQQHELSKRKRPLQRRQLDRCHNQNILCGWLRREDLIWYRSFVQWTIKQTKNGRASYGLIPVPRASFPLASSRSRPASLNTVVCSGTWPLDGSKAGIMSMAPPFLFQNWSSNVINIQWTKFERKSIVTFISGELP